MEWIDTFKQPSDTELGTPDLYTFVFRPPNDHGDYPMLRMPDNNQWPDSPFFYGEYHVGEDNPHLGEHMPREEIIHALGGVIMDRFFIRLGY